MRSSPFNTASWLPSVSNICIEIHGAECEKAVATALADYRYESGWTGEYALYLGITQRKPSTKSQPGGTVACIGKV